MELDTGSAVSVTNFKDYKTKFSDLTLNRTSVKLETYTKEIVQPMGVLYDDVEYQGQKKTLDFEGLGTLKGIKARLTVDDNATPKFHKARPVPYALKPKVEAQLDKLEAQAIIQKITHSEWAAPIVTPVKKNGEVRVCGDFKVTVNPVLKVDQYPLPSIEEIFSNLSGGQKFTKLDLASAYLQMEVEEDSQKYLTERQPHLDNLETVLVRLEEYGIKLNREKCYFFKDRIEYWGHFIDAKGLHQSSEKTDELLNARRPTNKAQPQSLLGFINYYRRFLPDLSTILYPLNKLLCDDVTWKWGFEQDSAFNKVKELIASDTVLMHYDPKKPLQLVSDGSPYGLGAVLSHVLDNGSERPIAFASRTLNSAERNYSQLEKEALSLVWSIKHFQQYLEGRSFTLFTDHQPLIFIFNPAKSIPTTSAARIQRWSVFLSGFRYTILYRKTAEHMNADCMSRLPLKLVTQETEKCKTDVLTTFHVNRVPISTATIRNETQKDPLLVCVLESTMKGWKEIHKPSPGLEPYYSRRDEFIVSDGCLVWGMRVVVPSKLRQQALGSLHEGHVGTVKMKGLARSYIWWPGIDSDIEHIAKSCHECQATQNKPPKSQLHHWDFPDRPWQRVHVDFAGPFKDRMFFVVVDSYTKWPEVEIMNSTTTKKTVDYLRALFARMGLPEQLVSDNGPQFTSSEFADFMRENGIRHLTSAPYHPATNGLAERFLQTFKRSISASDIDSAIQKNLDRLQYMNAPHSTTRLAPSMLLYGRLLGCALDVMKPDLRRDVYNQQSERSFHTGGRKKDFSVGDSVMVRNYRPGQKWLKGTVLNQSGPVSYEVQVGDAAWRRHLEQLRSTEATVNPNPELLKHYPAPPDMSVSSPCEPTPTVEATNTESLSLSPSLPKTETAVPTECNGSVSTPVCVKTLPRTFNPWKSSSTIRLVIILNL